MDTSKKYIKMCGKAREVQLYRTVEKRCKTGDFAYNVNEDIVEIQKAGTMLPAEDVWLPRQDQLQEMLDYTIKFELLEHFRMWYISTDATGQLDSMEQLWLRFVMKEKFNKEWRDDTWKKVD